MCFTCFSISNNWWACYTLDMPIGEVEALIDSVNTIPCEEINAMEEQAKNEFDEFLNWVLTNN